MSHRHHQEDKKTDTSSVSGDKSKSADTTYCEEDNRTRSDTETFVRLPNFDISTLTCDKPDQLDMSVISCDIMRVEKHLLNRRQDKPKKELMVIISGTQQKLYDGESEDLEGTQILILNIFFHMNHPMVHLEIGHICVHEDIIHSFFPGKFDQVPDRWFFDTILTLLSLLNNAGHKLYLCDQISHSSLNSMSKQFLEELDFLVNGQVLPTLFDMTRKTVLGTPCLEKKIRKFSRELRYSTLLGQNPTICLVDELRYQMKEHKSARC